MVTQTDFGRTEANSKNTTKTTSLILAMNARYNSDPLVQSCQPKDLPNCANWPANWSANSPHMQSIAKLHTETIDEYILFY